MGPAQGSEAEGVCGAVSSDSVSHAARGGPAEVAQAEGRPAMNGRLPGRGWMAFSSRVS